MVMRRTVMDWERLRKAYHKAICQQILGYRLGVLNIADKNSKSSVELAQGTLARMRFSPCLDPPNQQRADALFELITRDYLENALGLIFNLRPGEWVISVCEDSPLFDQYEYLIRLAKLLRRQYLRLHAAFGGYWITPDILVGRSPVSDQEVDRDASILEGDIASLTPVRASNFSNPKPRLHASISCKWTLRSDRAQNARAEALNLIRNRKGRLPHVVAVTAELLPTRIAALALGTGDLDCVYHFALPELKEAISEAENEDQMDMLSTLIEGRRLRDISDLPFDLAT